MLKKLKNTYPIAVLNESENPIWQANSLRAERHDRCGLDPYRESEQDDEYIGSFSRRSSARC